MEIKLDDHPAKCIHKTGPNAGEQMIGPDGKPISLVPDQHLIRVDGIGIGYCRKEPGGWISIIDALIDEPAKKVIVDEVKRLRGDDKKSTPQVSQTPVVPDDDEDDDDE